MKNLIKNKENLLDYIVVAGITLDFLPEYLLPDNDLSGIKLVFVLILYRLIKSPLVLKTGIIKAYFICWFFGMGLGFIFRNVSLDKLFTLFLNIPLFAFFLIPRDYNQIKKLFILIVILSIFPQLINVLSFYGYLEPVDVKYSGVSVIRYTSAISPSGFGLFAAFIPITLGGILVMKSKLKFFIGPVLIVICLFGILLSAQRSSTIIYAFSIVVGIMVSIRNNKKSLIFIFVVFFLIARTITFDESQLAIFESVNTRFNQIESTDSDPVQERAQQYRIFYNDLLDPNNIIGAGMELFSKQHYGLGTHFIFGEAFYYGGYIFLLFIIWLFFSILSKLIICYYKTKDTLVILLFFIIITMIFNMVSHSAMNVRIWTMTFGLSLLLANTIRQQNKQQTNKISN